MALSLSRSGSLGLERDFSCMSSVDIRHKRLKARIMLPSDPQFVPGLVTALAATRDSKTVRATCTPSVVAALCDRYEL